MSGSTTRSPCILDATTLKYNGSTPNCARNDGANGTVAHRPVMDRLGLLILSAIPATLTLYRRERGAGPAHECLHYPTLSVCDSDPDRRQYLVFMLFFFVNSPDDGAGASGQKRVTPEQIDQWKREHFSRISLLLQRGLATHWLLAARAKENTADFATAGDGNYALIIEAPAAQKPRKERALRLQCDQPERAWCAQRILPRM